MPKTYENIATPVIKMKAHINRSGLFLGWRSPNPTVERDVNAKYIEVRAALLLASWTGSSEYKWDKPENPRK